MPQRNLGLGIYLAIRLAYRRLTFGPQRRLSEVLIAAARAQLRTDAATAGQPPPRGLAVEVEVPQLIPHYRAYGFVELPVEYQEVRRNAEDMQRMEFHPVQLGIFPLDGETISPYDPTLLANTVRAFLVDNYGLSEEHWVVRRALESIKRLAHKGEDRP